MENKKFSFYTNLSIQETLAYLQTNIIGLDYTEAEKRLETYGLNEIKSVDVTWLKILKDQLLSPFMCIFFVIAFAYLITGKYTESLIILLIILVNVSIGFFQEYRSNTAMQALKNCLMSHVTVRRDNHEENILVNLLVPGDIIILSAGDIIPTDCRFIEVQDLSIDESSLTGESIAVVKTTQPMDQEITDMYKAKNIGFTGTIVTEGRGSAVVINTGSKTALGILADLTSKTTPKSTLERGSLTLARFTIYLIFFSLLLTALIHIIVRKGELNFIDFFLFAAALTITAIPEGLPMVITFCLSQGASILKKNDVIVKRLSAIADLGSIEVFCTDKTGTLTENALSIAAIYGKNPDMVIFYAALSCSEQSAAKESLTKGFDLAVQKELSEDQYIQMKEYNLIKEVPFVPQKRQSLALIEKDSIYTIILKGSPEIVIPKCFFLDDSEKEKIHCWIEAEELKGNRILAVTTKKLDPTDLSDNLETHDNNYETIGLLAFQDPLKPTALSTIKKAESLGVKIKILSGDSKNVCYTIAHQLGLEDSLENVVLGGDFEKATEEEKIFLVNNRSVFARVNPEQKYEIICHLQKKYSVGYMGDGINDAPALKIAHVSFAVNDAASVAREAAEIILLKKSLSSVILGIEEGRRTIVNTLKYTKMTNAPSFGHFYALAVASLLVSYPPMLPMQLLFLNLLTDLPMIAVSTDNVSPHEIEKPLTFDMMDAIILIVLFGFVMFVADITIFLVFKSHKPQVLQTSWFITSTISEVVFIFLFRTQSFFLTAQQPSNLLIILSLVVVLIAIGLPFTTIGHNVFLFNSPKWEHAPWLFAVVILNMIIAETMKLSYYQLKKLKYKNS